MKMNNKKTMVDRIKRKSVNEEQTFTTISNHTDQKKRKSHPSNKIQNCKRIRQAAKFSNIQAIDKVQKNSDSVSTKVLTKLCETLNSAQYNCNEAPRLEDDVDFRQCEAFDNDADSRNEIIWDQNSTSDTFFPRSVSEANVSGTGSGNEIIMDQCNTSKTGSMSEADVNGTDSGSEIIMDQNDASETFCSEPPNEANINEMFSSTFTTVDMNKKNDYVSCDINQTNTAFVQPVNKSLPCLKSGNIVQESSVSKPKNNASENASKKKTKMDSPDSVRRSRRIKTAPLATWKNQRSVHRVSESGDSIFVGIYEGLTESQILPPAVNNLREEKIEATKPKYKGRHCSEIDHIVVLDKRRDQEVCAEVMQPYKTLSWTSFCNSETDGYRIAKSLDSKEISFELLEFFPFEAKPEQCSPERNIYYSILFGAVKVKLNDSFFFAHLNDSFVVPCGNKYEITNVLGKKTTLMYCLFKKPILKALL